MTAWPSADLWHAACATDPVLAAWRGPWSVAFAIESDPAAANFAFTDGRLQPGGLRNSPWQPPLRSGRNSSPRSRRGIITRSSPCWPASPNAPSEATSCRSSSTATSSAASWRSANGWPSATPPRRRYRCIRPCTRTPAPAVTGRYIPVTAVGTTYQIYRDSRHRPRPAVPAHRRRRWPPVPPPDGRSAHRRIPSDGRLRSALARQIATAAGAIPGSWRLNTDLYVELIMGFVAAAGLDQPIVLGASMSGEICLELAYRHPEAFTGIVACEASERIERRQTPGPRIPR